MRSLFFSFLAAPHVILCRLPVRKNDFSDFVAPAVTLSDVHTIGASNQDYIPSAACLFDPNDVSLPSGSSPTHRLLAVPSKLFRPFIAHAADQHPCSLVIRHLVDAASRNVHIQVIQDSAGDFRCFILPQTIDISASSGYRLYFMLRTHIHAGALGNVRDGVPFLFMTYILHPPHSTSFEAGGKWNIRRFCKSVESCSDKTVHSFHNANFRKHNLICPFPKTKS